jgi:hypothetical protein
MKTKNIFYIAGLSLIFISCNRPPEKYTEGVQHLAEKKWDKAVDCFNQVPEDNKTWIDSATQKKKETIELMINCNDWKKLFKVVNKNASDEEFIENFKESIEKYFAEKSKNNQSDSALILLDNYKPELEKLIDTIVISKFIKTIEDNLFQGVWQGEGGLNEKEIYFQRQGELLNGLSSRNQNGWVKNSIIYKNIKYKGFKVWKVMPKLFHTDYWGNSSKSYSKKGTLTLIAKDTILINYETIRSSYRFHRKK